ncbi:MAG: class I SAM-dependent methyltransferase [Alphaproteobacteria bacterium]|nr:class I SAM-dependent methyltransferase [Alphaproteobacteria bacterium]MBL7096025.1 class I SAM-dependent methyltransferase [Alphaproteobacteria bacterium]
MKRSMLLAAGLTAALLGTAAIAAHTAATPAYVTAALADAGRPKDQVDLDAARKPAETVAFAGIRPGSKVMDLVQGQGYFTRIFAKVVGDKGFVYAYLPSELDPILAKRLPPGTDVKKQFIGYSNVSVLHGPVNTLAAPEALDVVFTAQNYHDFKDPFFAPADTALINKAVFNALKPGGFFVIIDHSAPNGSGIADTNTTHRIDEAVVKKEVEAAGFRLVAEGNFLRNPADPRDKLVFDPSIRHHTDQFVLKFQKPRH